MFFRMVYKSGQIFLPFCHNTRVWQTDRQTDRNLITIPHLHYMQRGKNHRRAALQCVDRLIAAGRLWSATVTLYHSNCPNDCTCENTAKWNWLTPETRRIIKIYISHQNNGSSIEQSAINNLTTGLSFMLAELTS